MRNEHTDKIDVSYLQTVSRALKVLNLFETETALSLAAISSRLGVSKTIAYRLAHTLVLDGFLIQDSATKQYMLGDQVLLLGFCAVQRQAVKRIAHDLIWVFMSGLNSVHTSRSLVQIKVSAWTGLSLITPVV